MYLRKPLDLLLGASSRLAVLRVLARRREEFTGREVARIAGVNHQAAHSALTLFIQAGIATRVRHGAAFSYGLNRDHELVRSIVVPAFETEEAFWTEIQKELRRLSGNGTVATILYGSAARMEEVPGSDLDVLVLVRSKSEAETVGDRWRQRVGLLHRRFGVGLSPLVYAVHEFLRLTRSRNRLALQILKEGRLICGKLPKEIRLGAKD